MAKANTLVGFWFAVKRDLNVEAEVDYIAIFYDVLFTFQAPFYLHLWHLTHH